MPLAFCGVVDQCLLCTRFFAFARMVLLYVVVHFRIYFRIYFGFCMMSSVVKALPFLLSIACCYLFFIRSLKKAICRNASDRNINIFSAITVLCLGVVLRGVRELACV